MVRKDFFLKESNGKSIFILIILFIASFSIFSFNLEEQAPASFEGMFMAEGIVYFNLLKEGDVFHPCWNGHGECELLVLNKTAGGDVHWAARSSAIRSFITGFGLYLSGISGENVSAWSWQEIQPTPTELAAGRFFSPILGSFTVVLAYLIGKLLFSRFVGLSFSVALLFHSVWLWTSRTTMTEIYLMFFMMLSIFLLLYSLGVKNKVQIKYLILSAIIFAIAVNTKLVAMNLLPFLMIAIFFRGSWFEKLDFGIIKNKKFILKSFSLLLIFLVVFIPSIIITDPFYYIDPIGQLNLVKDSTLSAPQIHVFWLADKPFITQIGTFSATIAPIIDYYYYNFAPDKIPETGSGDITVVSTFSSIPMSLFLLIGVGYLFLKIKRKNILLSEFLMLVWYFSMYVLTALMVETYNQSRYFVPLYFPMILIMSYGLWNFLTNSTSKRTIIIFFSLFMISHAITTLIFWEKFYFDPSLYWQSPLQISLQEALANPLVTSLGIIFLLSFIVIGIKKIRLLKLRGVFS